MQVIQVRFCFNTWAGPHQSNPNASPLGSKAMHKSHQDGLPKGSNQPNGPKWCQGISSIGTPDAKGVGCGRHESMMATVNCGKFGEKSRVFLKQQATDQRTVRSPSSVADSLIWTSCTVSLNGKATYDPQRA